MSAAGNQFALRWNPPPQWLPVAAVFGLLLVAFYSGLADLVKTWNTQEEYSFGYIVPVVTTYLLWQRRHVIAALAPSGAWSGAALVMIAIALLGVGQLATMSTVEQYAFLLAIFGLVLAWGGWPALRAMVMPLAILCFMVPLPNYLLRELSSLLQLWSSQLGVAVIRAFDITVYLEGNVIDLGELKLQVVEACSGLRYLIPLMTLGFIAACLFRAPLWKRALLFLTTIPITLLMNSARIGLIGILVDRFGKSQAEGFLHDFEGWAVFMVCIAILIGEIVLLARIGNPGVRVGDVFSLDTGAMQPPPVRATLATARRPWPFVAVAGLSLAAAITALFVPQPVHEPPPHRAFGEFPLQMQEWHGVADRLDPEYLDVLKLDDYVLADYANVNARAAPVNLYVAYYNTQTDGNSAHSPRACIPGDGWEISEFAEHEVPAVMYKGAPLRVNRVVISKGENQQLVYYWFQQRGRVATNEYMVKLQIFWDALTRHRSDGAMVRLVARLDRGQPVSVGDAELERFAAVVVPSLAGYIPD